MSAFPFMEDEYTGDFPIPTKEEGGSTDINIPVDIDNVDTKDSTADIVIDVSRRDLRRQELAAEDHRIMLAHLHLSRQLARSVAIGAIGQEDFSSFVANSLTGIANVLGHITNLFKVSIFHGWRDFKRGEITEYCESNNFTMSRLYRLPFNEYKHMTIPYPEGMVGTYFQALSSLKSYLDELNLLKRADQMVDVIKSIHSDLVKVNPSFKSHLADFNRIFIPSRCDKLFKDTGKFFTSKKQVKTEDTFGARFSSMGEFESTVRLCSDLDTHLRAVSSIHSRMETLELWMNRIVELGPKLEKNQINDLVLIAKTMADTFDSYATVINDVNRVGHNLVFVIEKLRKTANM